MLWTGITDRFTGYSNFGCWRLKLSVIYCHLFSSLLLQLMFLETKPRMRHKVSLYIHTSCDIVQNTAVSLMYGHYKDTISFENNTEITVNVSKYFFTPGILIAISFYDDVKMLGFSSTSACLNMQNAQPSCFFSVGMNCKKNGLLFLSYNFHSSVANCLRVQIGQRIRIIWI